MGRVLEKNLPETIFSTRRTSLTLITSVSLSFHRYNGSLNCQLSTKDVICSVVVNNHHIISKSP